MRVAAPTASNNSELPALSPQPQQVTARDDGYGWGGTVGLVRGDRADPIGSVDATYSELDADGSSIDAVRLTWAAGAPAPQVAEIILSEVE